MSEQSVSTVRPVTTQTKGRPMSEHGAPGPSTGEAAPTGGELRAVLPSVALNGVVPFLVYLLARPYLPGDAVALALAMAVPVVCTVGAFAWRPSGWTPSGPSR